MTTTKKKHPTKPDVKAIIPRRELQPLKNEAHLNWKVDITTPLWPAPGRPVPVLRTAFDIAEDSLDEYG